MAVLESWEERVRLPLLAPALLVAATAGGITLTGLLAASTVGLDATEEPSPTGVAGQQTTALCILVTGVATSGDWDAESLHDGITSGTAVIEDVFPPVACSLAKGTTSAPKVGDWEIGDIEHDPITDKPSATVRLEGQSDTAPLYIGGQPDKPTLVIGCLDGRTSIRISWHDVLFYGKSARIALRLDEGQPTFPRWEMGRDDFTTSYPRIAELFIRSLFGGDVLVAQVNNKLGDPITATFNITGIKDAVANVREVCDW